MSTTRLSNLEFHRSVSTLQRERDEALALVRQQAAQLRTLHATLTHLEQQERRALSQALHDHLQPLLVAARIKLGILCRHLDDKSTQHVLQQLDGLLQEGIAETRSLTTRLVPPVFQDRGLIASLEWMAQQIEQQFHLHVEWSIDAAAEPQAEDTRIFLFHAVRELLFNIVKHAQVEVAQVELTRRGDDYVQLVVSDAGKGFEPAMLQSHGCRSGGFGLTNLCQRLEFLGGTVEIDSSPGRGARIVITVPIEPFGSSRAGDALA